ncbi:hypothetical protein [Nocardia carnea]|uniref:hypothetical protein n=1 Tax=Nocardia carnea TaxID=37328 RepID=UPI0024541A48|nr:hypothetical protein [Nocardia carnea]
MDIVELRTPTAIVRHGAGRLIVLRPGADGDTETDGERVLDVAVTDLLEVRLSRRADDAVVIEIYLRYPTPVLVGVPADRTPLPVLIAEHDVPAAAGIVSRINDQILAAQRIDIAAPDLTAPPVEVTDRGPVRADVDRAIRRMSVPGRGEPALTDLHRLVTGDEYVLETAYVIAHPPVGDDDPCLLTVTTRRLLLIALGPDEPYAHELPIEMIMRARATEEPPSMATGLLAGDRRPLIEVHDGNTTMGFTGLDRADTERVTYAVNFAVRLVALDGSAGPADPSVAHLYSEWELLVERHSLGMVDDTQFQRYGRGILRSLPGI